MNTDKYPRFSTDFVDISSCIDTFLLAGLPRAPLFSAATRVLTQGSCFAENIFAALQARGIAAHYMRVPENSNSPLGNSQGMLREGADLSFVRDFDVFIFTMGVSFGPEKETIGFHTVDDNVGALRTIVGEIRRHNPDIAVVLSVSPVPLNRGFGLNMPAVMADCLSKSTLRVAIDAYMREAPAEVYYWPSFEIVRWLVPHAGPTYGADDGQTRHVNQSLIDLIVAKFLQHFGVGDISG